MEIKDISKNIIVKGAKENNLKNIDVNIPKNKLVVMTGLSGSGKSSLAFDTIYAEGQRRYLESLSSYARQFLGGNEKPNVDSIDGLSPTISIDQKTTSHNPRSTVGTITEIYDYMRLLWARIGTPFCPNGHGEIETLTNKQIVNKIYDDFNGIEKIQLLSPIVSNAKGTFKNELDKLRMQGFLRVRIDKLGYSLDDEFVLEKNKFHNIEIVVDRVFLNDDKETMSRLSESIESCAKQSSGNIIVVSDDKEVLYSLNHCCKVCGFSISEMEPRLFSFNSPIGYCNECNGLGYTFEPDENKMMPDRNLSINQGAIRFFKNTMHTDSLDWQEFNSLLTFYKINKDTPIKDLSKKEVELMMYGSDEPIDRTIVSNSGIAKKKCDYIEGVLSLIKRRHIETSSELARELYSSYISEKKCKKCKGYRLSESSLSVLINNKNIIEVTRMSVDKMLDFFIDLELTKQQQKIANMILKEIVERVNFLINVGLNYLTLDRSASTLSGGEAQRIRLATQIGSSLTGILYVLDEPSIGLHQKDNDKLLKTLKKMRDLGNTLIIVEHDEETIRNSDYIIDIGPGAGVNGGSVVVQGTINEVVENKESITGKYLSGECQIEVPKTRRSGNGKKIIIKGATGNNLKNINVTFPLGKLVVVTGVSGSGKSTLINETLVKNIQKIMFSPFVVAAPIKDMIGIQSIDKLTLVTQDPIGRTPRSNPATYVGVFDDIREIFSQTNEAKARGYTKGRFSFNVSGGRCEKCQGDGWIKISMHFLPDVYIKCDECHGQRYNDETLSVKYKSKTIYDVLEMTVDEALDFFANIPAIRRKLELMVNVGLGYLKLGVTATSLSGGEAQRIKLAKFLQRKSSSDTIVVLDEPTTGLHTHDIKKLISVLNTIVDNGSTVIVIEHNLDLIKCADFIIDMGPDGGENGGKIIATGTPEQLISHKDISYTAQYLSKVLK